ncbi:right-handed parallel beta-helix repeat-containing protein [Xinfangfangia sp. CPCC 101601]|uniref:Right-handed parallel beta-helix repeat-containing protein n=1 Tax=Pseudogemmobacter lacusdianii TaxID=3069608 RepID=A0ABU0VZY6_9RHOB|nr:right-handed parallel beta-helix repeat-containing protein [Xinfangfangia sp. CPCC 101601]MDQ2067321.1 right-handed parallel beta-helix repeat-containing protein [Xinfangfangia sp. CPCC 101601]
MNKVITEGLVLMPPAFAAGLSLWSSGNGRPGDASYNGASNAAYVSNDADFAGCLELKKTSSTQRLRSFSQTPLRRDMYLRISARVKAVSGNLPSVRIALWAGDAASANVTTAVQTGPSVALTDYGSVVTIEAIVGAGNRTGVAMPLGATATFAHIGIDLTGANGGTVRIDDLVVEDVTSVFLRDMMDMVDVRDYGAKGDGSSNDIAAFMAADAAAAGRTIVVSQGSYNLPGNLTINAPIRFQGTVVQPAANRLILTRNFDLETYSRAFNGDVEGFKRALQALFYFTDHVTFDMSGRRVDLTEPLDVAALAGLNSFTNRRVLRNGSLNAVSSSGWTNEVVTSVGTYAIANSTQLTAVANVANVPVGALVQSTGVGREVYVKSKNIGAGTVELSQPLYAAAGTRTYTFTRFKYLMDFSNFALLSRFEIHEVEFNCLGSCSGVLLPMSGTVFRFDSCTFNRPKDRGISSAGTGCQGMWVDYCQFLSNEQPLNAQDRSTIAINVQANDVKFRNNRIVRFKHFAVMNGTSHMICNNHFFQGDDAAAGVRLAGIVFTQTNVATVVSGNYIDNCFIEWGNEHDPEPGFSNEFSFGGLNVVGNIFIASDVSAAFRWIVVKPYGSGHFFNGFSLVNNTFRVFNATVDRVEMVDTSFASLDFTRSRNVRVKGNTFNQVSQTIQNPIVMSHSQTTAADTWVLDPGGFTPFGARIRTVESVMPEGAITNAANVTRFNFPNAVVGQGPGGSQANLRWGEAVKGKVTAVLRMDVTV